MEKIDLRTVTLDVPAQDVISKDNAPVNVETPEDMFVPHGTYGNFKEVAPIE